MKRFFHFLGSLPFAIGLIAVTAIMVILGTVLESWGSSHLLAARWIYEHPFFSFLLSLFFINILFSTLRRWPFKIRHIPFLMTHLGLLMMIGGTMIKHRLGLQGELTVWEGSGNQHVLLPHTYALAIENRVHASDRKAWIALESFHPATYHPPGFPQLKCKIIGYAPHVKEKLDTWIKGSHAAIAGFPPLPVQYWEPSQPFPEAMSHSFRGTRESIRWSVLALRTSHVKEAMRQAYLQKLTLALKGKEEAEERFDIPLQQALQSSFSFGQGDIHSSLDLPFPCWDPQEIPALHFTWTSRYHQGQERLTIPLQGQHALLLRADHAQGLKPFFAVDIRRPHPLLCLVEEEGGETFLFAFDAYGRVHQEKVTASSLQTLISCEEGFGGYRKQVILPIPSFPCSREDKERAEAYELKRQLQQALTQHPPLSPPLAFFAQGCAQGQVDLSTAIVQFLVQWDASPHFLYHPLHLIPEPLSIVLNHLNWEDISSEDYATAQWIYCLLDQLEESCKKGITPLEILESHGWPFIEELKEATASAKEDSVLNLLSQQISSIIRELPPIDFPLPQSNQRTATLLSAYFRAYGIGYRSLMPWRENGKEEFDQLESYWKADLDFPKELLRQTTLFETPLSHRVIPEPAPLKPEDQCPGIVLEVEEGEDKHSIALAYDSSARGLKWPILYGHYLIRLQPIIRELPYRVRLRQAREIRYPHSQQIYSYESDVQISEDGLPPVEQTLSMNDVYETWDGYRFYLAGIGHSADLSLKYIRLVVNYDPAKYFLTYPGAALLLLGTILLFWVYTHSTARIGF